MSGTWNRYYGPEDEFSMPFHAHFGDLPRFALPQMPAEDELVQSRLAAIEGRWSVKFSKSDDPAVGIFAPLDDYARTGRVRGTFLTTLGDYRYLEGTFDGMTLLLSCFDGAHAFFFRARLGSGGDLRGDFFSRTTWHEHFTATRDADATLPDPLELTEWTASKPLSSLSFPDLNGKQRSLADPEFSGKARILVLFGTWCPNCYDESDFMVELDQRYGDRGLAILGLAFEFGDDFERNAKQVARYAEHHGIKYPILVAGNSDKGRASAAFPLLDRVRAYPTTTFLDRDDQVRAVYTGFSGPATGEAHTRVRERFQSLVEELLSEPKPAK